VLVGRIGRQAAIGYYRALFDPARFGSPAGMEEQRADRLNVIV
jgi:hypothetical protein